MKKEKGSEKMFGCIVCNKSELSEEERKQMRCAVHPMKEKSVLSNPEKYKGQAAGQPNVSVGFD